jgi:rfaE bifunctional protein kinase chain/domain
MFENISKAELENLFNQFEGKRILVIGDVMLDAYWWGKVDRISPEAPVPIVHVTKKEFRLGGAANVALNLKTLGAVPVLCAVIGQDQEADIFLEEAAKQGIASDGILSIPSRPTTIKTRVIGQKNQMLRIDTEDNQLISEQDSDALFERILLQMEDAALIIFEDYDKGVLSEALITGLIFEANTRHIPIAVDPKKRNFHAYAGATLFKPNLRELAEGLKLEINAHSPLEEIQSAANLLIHSMHFKYVMVTLSERGVYITDGIEGYLIPAHIRSISDVSGAGDTVISVAALSMLTNMPMDGIAALANLAGGLVCEKAGVVPIQKDELMHEAERIFVAQV